MSIHDTQGNSSGNPNQSPNLENLKKQAKSLLKSVRAGNSDALKRVGPYFGKPTNIGLQSTQLVLAREYGFSSWTRLKCYAEQGTLSAELKTDQLANRFLDLVVLQYSQVRDIGPARFTQAGQLLNDNPGIRTYSIHTAAAIGDVEMIDHWLDNFPNLLDLKGGFHSWEPLMYATYARLPGRSTLNAALRLLQRGANPNSYYMWNGQYKFTALTGAFGEGEGGPINQPEHPDYLPLCRALLQHGANANDSQAAYNRCFQPDNACLELLLEFGLNAKDKNNWLLLEDDKLVSNPAQTLQFHLVHAIRNGFTERVKLLIDHGIDPNIADNTYDNRTKGKSPYEVAMLLGKSEIADYLLANGAKEIELSTLSRFQAACISGNRQAAELLLRDNPDLAQAAKAMHRELLCDAVAAANQQALKLMIKLGFNLNDNSGRLPLANAAWDGNLDIVKLLLKGGADPTLRDPVHFTPPTGFAQYTNKTHVVEFLDTIAMDIFTAASRGKIDKIEQILKDRPEQLDMRFGEIRPALDTPCDNDWMTPLVYATLSNQLEVVHYLLDKGANPQVNDGAGLSLSSLAQSNASEPEVLAAIEAAIQDS